MHRGLSGHVDERDDVFEQAHLLNVVLEPGVAHCLGEDSVVDQRINDGSEQRQRTADN
jgi:hypothetical protein